MEVSGQLHTPISLNIHHTEKVFQTGNGKHVPVLKVPRHADVLGSGGIAPRILDLGTRWGEWSAPRSSRFIPRYPLDRRLGGPQSRSGRGGEETNSQPPPGIEP
jgi:hypothetical protein